MRNYTSVTKKVLELLEKGTKETPSLPFHTRLKNAVFEAEKGGYSIHAKTPQSGIIEEIFQQFVDACPLPFSTPTPPILFWQHLLNIQSSKRKQGRGKPQKKGVDQFYKVLHLKRFGMRTLFACADYEKSRTQ